jgi:hypothetical protein
MTYSACNIDLNLFLEFKHVESVPERLKPYIIFTLSRQITCYVIFNNIIYCTKLKVNYTNQCIKQQVKEVIQKYIQ